MLNISALAKIEKNKLATNSAWILLLKITLPDTTIIRVSGDNTDTVWAGETWIKFPFEIDEIGESTKGEVPQFEVRVGNITGVMQAYMELDANFGGVGSEVELYLVNSSLLADSNPTVNLSFECVSSNCDRTWAHFILGAANPYNNRFPRNRILKNFCRYDLFTGSRCQYVGVPTTCDRTLARCRELGNSHNFGGAPATGRRGLYV